MVVIDIYFKRNSNAMICNPFGFRSISIKVNNKKLEQILKDGFIVDYVRMHEV